MSFVSDVINGKAELSDICAYRKRWSNYEEGSTDLTCYEFLGLSFDEYALCVGGHDIRKLALIIEDIKHREFS